MTVSGKFFEIGFENSIHFKGLLWKINERMIVSQLVHYLAHSKGSVTISLGYYHYKLVIL